MYRRADVVPEALVRERLEGLSSARPLRLVYCGRMVARKGLHVSLEVLHRARLQGVTAEFDVIGAGPDEPALRRQAEELGLAVRFLGSFPYGSNIIRRLAGYDLLLFTPTEEDTPRMLFDGYAAGLPVLGTRIPFVEYRAGADRAASTFPVGDAAAGAKALAALDGQRDRLRDLSLRAREAGLHHASENWRQRLRDWTLEAVERRRAAARAGR